MKPLARSAILQRSLARRGGRDQLHERKVLPPADFGQRRRFLGGQVGHDRPGQPRFARRGYIGFQPLAVNDGVADHRHDGGLQVRHYAAQHVEDFAKLDLVAESPRVRTLDHRTVGDGVAVGDAQFAEAAAASRERAEQIGGERQIGVAGRDERHKGLALGGAKFAKEDVDGGHWAGSGELGAGSRPVGKMRTASANCVPHCIHWHGRRTSPPSRSLLIILPAPRSLLPARALP